MFTVFLVDSHDIVRRGLVDLIESDPDLRMIGESGSASLALAEIPSVQPDVAVIDTHLPDGNGVELCRQLMLSMPSLRCLVLASYTDDQSILDAIVAGAKGYLLKDIVGMDLTATIKDIGGGKSLLDNRAAAVLITRLRDHDLLDQEKSPSPLTEQERTLLGLLGEGLTNRQIGERLHMAEYSVMSSAARLLVKLGTERRMPEARFSQGIQR